MIKQKDSNELNNKLCVVTTPSTLGHIIDKEYQKQKKLHFCLQLLCS